MSDCQREMTLEEWVYSLPEIHKARKQYEELKALTTPATVLSEPKLITCPFCGEDDFDLIGLKQHLLLWCEEYVNTPHPKSISGLTVKEPV